MNNQKLLAEEEIHDVGKRIRMLREQRNLSQRELALASELSPNTLSLIERGKTSPTAATLQKLSGALKVSISALFESGDTGEHIVFTRSRQRPRFAFAHGYAEDLGPADEQALVSPLTLTLQPGAKSGNPMRHSGKEFVYCLSGQILYAINDEIFLLEPGDSLIFDADCPHRWQNAGGEPAEAVMVLCMSEEGADYVIHNISE